MIKQHISTPVKDISYKDASFIDMVYEYKYAVTKESKNVIYSIKWAPETAWEDKCSASTTSPAILKFAAPKRTPADTLKVLLEGQWNYMLKIVLYKNIGTRLYWGIMISIARNRKRLTIEEQGVAYDYPKRSNHETI
ncbi:NmrA-like family protein [Penicillium robsamsonii]|uniref:NmrA-like family protein n=1 Tax=Penicillium robsamsonii TaxID=1792511 RepID=UPI002548F91B|nr:NmrA-like family protein [Penicillium robsamsonii]KAJ5822720.1 NmrA-like family protein [Penicillium robsamsonii]